LSALTYPEYRAMWESMTEEERDRVRAKAEWEHMSLWAVLDEWPSLRPAGEGDATEGSQ
jgi:hypothetical protein